MNNQDPNYGTGTTAAQNNSPFHHNQTKSKKPSIWTTIKKIIYFTHFILIAILTTHVLIKYQHARQFSFTICALIVYGYMAIWTIIVNFVFLSFGKQNWAVMFDRIFIKFFMMLWPIFAVISYVHEQFLNITEVALFSLYMCVISLLLVIYQLYSCIFAQHQNPQFIFEHNDLKHSDDTVWHQRKLYNQNLIKRNQVNIDV